ncbi:hypothetical protein [Cohnella sp. GbtcB17]|uniref:hypothetical protein n=1 Tax=Cohnella sp. GbtcB17 TaxID=2824762 RepID=UPI001C2F2563|nr:hypothetical protein [Cohnella sp. GbtcB17]
MTTFNLIFKQFKKDLSTSKMILRFITFRSQIKATILFIFIFLFSHLGSYTNQLYYIPMFISAIFLYWFIDKELSRIRNRKYGTKIDFLERKYVILIDLLEKQGIYNPSDKTASENKIHYLIEILNEKLRDKKRSTKLISFLGTIVVLLARLIPFSELKEVTFNQTTLLWLTLSVQLLGIFIMAYPILFEILNRNHSKMDEMRNMLYEIIFKKL